jgi:hypothetical protein
MKDRTATFLKSKMEPLLLQQLLRYETLLFAAFFILMFLIAAARRFSFPYDLEWMEGGVADHVLRILSGKQLYVEPSLDFIPYTYTPLYFYTGALFSLLLGDGYLPLRLISILATLGGFALVFMLVRRETGSGLYGMVGAGLMAATYVVSGTWFDLARADSLFLLLLLASIVLLRFSEEPVSLFLAGLLMSLSFLTKQTAAFMAVAMSIYCLVYLPRWRKAVFPLTFAAIVGLSTLVFNLISDGWYFYYIFRLPRKKGTIAGQVTDFWLSDMKVLYLSLALALAFLLILLFWWKVRDFAFYGLFFISMVGSSWLVSDYQGSYSDVLIPALAAMAILAPMGANLLVGFATAGGGVDESAFRQGGGGRGRGQGRMREVAMLGNFVLLVLLLQFVFLLYNPLHQAPSAEDRTAGDMLVDLLDDFPGEVWVPTNGYLAHKAGKAMGAQMVAINDVYEWDGELSDKIAGEYRRAMEDRRYDAVILYSDISPDFYLRRDAEKNAVEATTLVGKVFFDSKTFFPATGAWARPDMIFIFRPGWDWDRYYRKYPGMFR